MFTRITSLTASPPKDRSSRFRGHVPPSTETRGPCPRSSSRSVALSASHHKAKPSVLPPSFGQPRSDYRHHVRRYVHTLLMLFKSRIYNSVFASTTSDTQAASSCRPFTDTTPSLKMTSSSTCGRGHDHHRRQYILRKRHLACRRLPSM